MIVEPLGSNAVIDASKEKNLQLVSIASLSNPLDETVEAFSLLPLVSPIQPLTLDSAMTFSLPLSSQFQQLFGKYQVHKLLLPLITLDAMEMQSFTQPRFMEHSNSALVWQAYLPKRWNPENDTR